MFMRNLLSRFLLAGLAVVLGSVVGCGRSDRSMGTAESNRLYAQDLWKSIIAIEAEAASSDEASFINRVATECVPKVVPQSYARDNIDSILVRPSLELWRAAANGEARSGIDQVAVLLRFKSDDKTLRGIAFSFAGERLDGAAFDKSDMGQMRVVFPETPSPR
jgi:hypothetical protein